MKKSSLVRHILIDAFFVLLGGGLLLIGGGLLWVANLKIPDLDSFSTRQVSQSTKIFDRTGEILLYDVHSDVRRSVVPYGDISRNIKNATVAIEDAEFYEHSGVRPMSFLRAVLANIRDAGYSQGGSTITQQVIKNSLLTTEKSISRKLKEWILALKIERILSKDEILAYYLNESPYGGNMYGVEEASRSFFGKTSGDLSVAEAAYIAAIPQAPTYFSPHGNNRQALENRKNLVLNKMLEGGFLSPEEHKVALAEKVTFLPPDSYGIKAPHFVLLVKEYLEEKYGRKAVEDGGLRVITTLDYALQQKAEEMVKKSALSNQKSYNAENAALVATDPKNGDILVMVGSRDYFDKEIDGNFNVALSKRQPGSSFKPFVYATAFKKGYTPETVLFDVKTEFSTECNPDGSPLTAGKKDVCYMPANYDHVYHGPVSLRNALAQSINVPAIKTLYLAGIKDSLETAKDLGINTLTTPDRYGLTLVLGGGEVTLLEMVGAYGVFAAEGVRNTPHMVLSVTNATGEVLESFLPSPVHVLDANICRMITDILADNTARTPAFGAQSFLKISGKDVAVKTGTTNDYRDAWIVGYSPNLVVGAWAGNNDNSSMEKKVAGFIIAPLWNEFITAALATLPTERFAEALPPENESGLKPVLRGVWQGNQEYIIDSLSGNRATEFTPLELRKTKVVREIHTILHWVDKKDPLGPPPSTPQNDWQYSLWEYGVRQWASQQNLPNEDISIIPLAADNIHRPEYAPQLSILGLTTNPYKETDKVLFSVAATGPFPLAKVDVFLNGKYLGSVTQAPFAFSFIPKYTEGIRPENELLLVGYDNALNKGEISMPLFVSF